ncbi:MAG: DUF4465 domain-containing protein, partial [Phycisphaeraceae bacterium]
LLGLCLAAAAAAPATAHVNIDFEELTAPGPLYGDGAGFESRGVDFAGGVFSGWTYSAVNDSTTPGFMNQYAAFTGTGFDSGDDNYAVSFVGSRDAAAITLPVATTVRGMFVTNTTYAALSMLDGDAFSKQFGGPTGDDPDFFRLNIFGVNEAGEDTGSVTVDLADYTFADNSKDFVLDYWKWVDLSVLGDDVASLEFSLESSDVGDFGINTPTYFAMDNLILNEVPEPSTLVLFGVGAACVLARRRKRA